MAFGIAHGIGLYTIVGFFSGIILSTIYETTRNIKVPIGVHMINNATALLCELFMLSECGTISGSAYFTESIFLVTAISLLLFVVYERKKVITSKKKRWVCE